MTPDYSSELDAALQKTGSVSGRSFFNPEVLATAAQANSKSRERLIEMPIDDFLAMAERLEQPTPSKKAKVDSVLQAGLKFDALPHLGFEHDGNGTAQVVSHEGRHRSLALKKLGVDTVPVVLISLSGKGDAIRWGSQQNRYDRIRGEWPKVLQGQSGGELPFPIPDLR